MARPLSVKPMRPTSRMLGVAAYAAARMGTDQLAGHVVLCGLDDLGYRTLEEFRRLGEEVVVIARRPSETFAARARALGARVVIGDYRDESVLRDAGVAAASAIVIEEDDDVGNLHAALAAQELNERIRISLRMFNQELGQRVQRLFHDCSVVDSAAIAAPAFVAAALQDNAEQRIEVAGRTLVVREGSPSAPDVMLALARTRPDGSAELFPTSPGTATCLALAPEAAAPEQSRSLRRMRRRAPLSRTLRTGWAVVGAADRRLRYLLLLLLALTVFSVALFSRFLGLDLLDALYFTVTIITTTGFGDISLRDAAPGLQLYGTALMLLGTATLAVFFALMTDAIVGARLDRALGRVPHRMEGHVVVCGLGNVGYRVVELLVRSGVPVAASELHATGRFIPAARRLGVPVVVADARLPETLRALRVSTARALIVATNDDVANLETALNARGVNPDLRVVLRLFDPDFAARVERAFGIHISRSVSALAAPAFVSAAEGERVIATLPVGVRALIVAQARVEVGSGADGRSVADLERTLEARVLKVSSDGAETWRPPGATILAPGSEVIVVASRKGLADVIDRTEAPAA